METNAQLIEAISTYRQTLSALLASAQEAGESISSALTAEDTTEAEQFVERIETEADAYLLATEQVREIVAPALSSDSGGFDPADAHNRIAAAAGGDFLAAQQLFAISALDVGEEIPTEIAALRTEFVGPLSAPLDFASVDHLIADVVIGLGAQEIAGASPLDAEKTGQVETACDSILTSGGKNVGGAIKLLTLMEWSDVEKLMRAAFGDELEKAVGQLLERLKGWFKRLRRLAVRLLNAGLRKLRDWLGAERVDKVIQQAKDLVKKVWDDIPGGNTAGKVMAGLFQRDKLVADVDAILSALPPDEAGKRLSRIEGVASAHGQAAKYVGWGVTACAAASHWLIGASPGGPLFFICCGVLLAVVSAWLVHDRLDAPGMSFLPDLLIGVERAAQGA